MLSILIPTFNDDCCQLVKSLVEQTLRISLAEWEIIIADDGSTDKSVITRNETLKNLKGCRYFRRNKNVGRAAIRNFLVTQARGEHLLFIDADMTLVDSHYLKKYLDVQGMAPVVYGGYRVGDGSPSNLRFTYEKRAARNHSVTLRNRHPYLDFHTSNFMVERHLMEAVPFDERFCHYGFEDVFFGKQLLKRGIKILHIDNPVGFDIFETNFDFIKKTEEGLRTLRQFHDELQGYSPLLSVNDKLERFKLKYLVSCILHMIMKPLLQVCLSSHPNVLAFYLYKLGYYLSLN